MDKKFSNIVLNIPHASCVIPVYTWQEKIDDEIWKWTDWNTDVLFQPNVFNVKPVIFPVSRFFCDFERLQHDPLEKQGQGIFYTNFNGCIRKKDEAVYNYAMTLYANHKAFINGCINKDTLLIDCHSFPTDVAPNVDICIGYNDDWSKPSKELINLVVDLFLHHGYNVDINSPYSNSLTPKDSKDYKSFMIEVNKKCYLFADNTMTKKGYELNNLLNYLYKNILYSWSY